MKYVTADFAKQAALKGVTVELVKVDKGLKEIVLTDAAGRHVRIVKDDGYPHNLRLLVPMEHETVERFHLSGPVVEGGPVVSEYFESEYDAKERARSLSEKVRGESLLSVCKARVLIGDDGVVVGPAPIEDTARAPEPVF